MSVWVYDTDGNLLHRPPSLADIERYLQAMPSMTAEEAKRLSKEMERALERAERAARRTWDLDLVIPGPPVGYRRPMQVGRGAGRRGIKPDTVVEWELRAEELVRRAWGERAPLDCPVELEVVEVLARPQRLCRKRDDPGRLVAGAGKPDLDNVVKLAADVLVRAGVLVDDTRVARLGASKWYAAVGEQPRTEVRVGRA